MTKNQEEDIVSIKKTDLIEVKDFWDKHNFGTRITLITFVISFLIVVIAGFYGVVVPDTIVKLVGNSALIGFITVTLGVNGLKILLDGITKIKMCKK